MAERATIARPYARAAFEYAQAAGAFGAWSQGLGTAAAIIADSRVAAFTKDPRWTPANLTALVADVGGDALGGGIRNFIGVLAENHRLLLLPEIAAQFEVLRAAVENTIDVHVASAVALDDAQSAQLVAALTQRFHRQVRVQTSVDPSLLGGAVVRAGDLVIDGSLKTRLERLATELTA